MDWLDKASFEVITDESRREYLAALEDVCWASLVDPAGRGVLVIDRPHGWTIRLDPSVPSCTVAYKREWT